MVMAAAVVLLPAGGAAGTAEKGDGELRMKS